jgi:hypothetical protein
MIVKDESHIINSTLEMLCDKINFTYWVICDTGSSDNTKTIIMDFFNSKKINGELHECKWQNFAENRNIALELAFNKTDMLFIFDADDEIHGNIQMPTKMEDDGYSLQFGNATGVLYNRILLVNNRIKWNYKGVIHEYIACTNPNAKIKILEGDYYIVSGKTGNRNLDPNKYINDALILEKAYYETKNNNDKIYLRYCFYCANSYRDANNPNEAIKWYKISLNHEIWTQEKYMCCLNLFYEYNKIGENEKGMFYLFESFKYDTERFECIFYIIRNYCLTESYSLSYFYYNLIKDFYEHRYINTITATKLFVEPDKGHFSLPYNMIIVYDRLKNDIPNSKISIIKMYEIIFIKKYPINDEFYIKNLLDMLLLHIDYGVMFSEFIPLFQSYIVFLEDKINIDLSKYECLTTFIKYGIKIKTGLQLHL